MLAHKRRRCTSSGWPWYIIITELIAWSRLSRCSKISFVLSLTLSIWQSDSQTDKLDRTVGYSLINSQLVHGMKNCLFIIAKWTIFFGIFSWFLSEYSATDRQFYIFRTIGEFRLCFGFLLIFPPLFIFFSSTTSSSSSFFSLFILFWVEYFLTLFSNNVSDSHKRKNNYWGGGANGVQLRKHPRIKCFCYIG